MMERVNLVEGPFARKEETLIHSHFEISEACIVMVVVFGRIKITK